LTARAIASTGCNRAESRFCTHMHATSAVSGRTAARNASGATTPFAAGATVVTSTPRSTSARAASGHRRMLDALSTTCLTRAPPSMASALASVRRGERDLGRLATDGGRTCSRAAAPAWPPRPRADAPDDGLPPRPRASPPSPPGHALVTRVWRRYRDRLKPSMFGVYTIFRTAETVPYLRFRGAMARARIPHVSMAAAREA